MSQREVLRLYFDKIKEEKRTMAQEAKDDSHQKKKGSKSSKSGKGKDESMINFTFSYD